MVVNSCTSTPTWIYAAFGFCAVAGILLLLYVMQKTWLDRINRIDPQWLQETRRAAFIMAALALVFAVMDDLSPLSTLLLVGSAIILLAINAWALHLRTPPRNGFRVRHPHDIMGERHKAR